MELWQFGYAPGDYMTATPCFDCGCKIGVGVHKRSYRCEPCATVARDDYVRRQDTPHICDMNIPYVG